MKTFNVGQVSEQPKGYAHFLALHDNLDPLLYQSTYVKSQKALFGERWKKPAHEFVAHVNARVNRLGRWQAEELDKWTGLQPKWREGKLTLSGDCEDFAITKMERLVAGGIPRGALRLAVCMLGDEAHAVLLAFVDGSPVKPLVLDQRFATPLEYDKAPHRWIAAEVFYDPTKQPDDAEANVRWRRIGKSLEDLING